MNNGNDPSTRIPFLMKNAHMISTNNGQLYALPLIHTENQHYYYWIMIMYRPLHAIIYALACRSSNICFIPASHMHACV